LPVRLALRWLLPLQWLPHLLLRLPMLPSRLLWRLSLLRCSLHLWSQRWLQLLPLQRTLWLLQHWPEFLRLLRWLLRWLHLQPLSLQLLL
jgi:hypothetical protein